MKRSMWVPLAISVVSAYILLDRRATRYGDKYNDMETVASRTSDWGSKQRFTGTGKNLVGRLKEGFGRLTGNPDLAEEGVANQVAGAVQDTTGKAAHFVSDTIHDLNR